MSIIHILALAALLPALEAQPFTSVRFTGVTWEEVYRNDSQGAIRRGTLRVDEREANAHGGYVIVTVLDDQGRCPGTQERFRLSWTFEPDANELRFKGRPLIVRPEIRLIGGVQGCIDVNPSIGVDAESFFGYAPGSPTGGSSYYFSGAKSGGYHSPGPWGITAVDDNRPGDGYFFMRLTGFGGRAFELKAVYHYRGATGGPPTPSGGCTGTFKDVYGTWLWLATGEERTLEGTRGFGSGTYTSTSGASGGWRSHSAGVNYQVAPGNRFDDTTPVITLSADGKTFALRGTSQIVARRICR